MAEKNEDRAGGIARPSDELTVTTVTPDAAIAAAEAVAGFTDRLAAILAQRDARQAATKAFRADHERRRQYAHPKRHAVKLGRAGEQ